MTTFRKNAFKELLSRKPTEVKMPATNISEYFGVNVFNKRSMQEYLSKEAYKKVMEAVVKGTRIERKFADEVALGMKTWALKKGASHFTHWFQPLTGLTAEKHDAFFEPTADGYAIDKFSGSELVQQEPDASSFPSGGIRNTFEARGYTAWDPTSPAFVWGNTLCIPTIFISYTGEALDNKTPLLNAVHALDKIATEVCQYFDKDITKVTPTLGWEQEYFLIDSALYNARPDLVLTGRTLFGHSPARGQQLEDHYFGSIPERASAFIKDFEIEALKLGVPVRTRHNEVAPNQFECAPIFQDVNLAVDHNQLLMDLMEKVARRHNFRVLFHEKPFAGINGSGKHNNWSMATNTGVNLLQPGNNPKTNLRFLTFFVNTIKAVHDYSEILRASIASIGNDHRLGANEAPPAIISVFIGSQLTKILDDLEKNLKGSKLTPEKKTEIKLKIGKIPDILLDNTDRNRTSPFAFTGNKFELRAVGSSANCAQSMTVLNTIVAKQLKEFKNDVDKLIDKGFKKDDAILNTLKKHYVASKNVLFEGNGYSDEWPKDAEKRGLPNIKSTPEALEHYISKKSIKLFESMDVLTEKELHGRYEIFMESFSKRMQIESRVAGDLATNHVVPAAIYFQNRLIDNVRGLTALGLGSLDLSTVAETVLIETANGTKSKKKTSSALSGSTETDYISTQLGMIKSISHHIYAIKSNVDKMIAERKVANKIEDTREHTFAYLYNVKPYLETIRYHVDKLEIMVDDELWTLPKYREMLFTR